MLTVENANLHYGAAQALRGISIKADMGKITCVLGRNGVGKSSLLRAVTGQHPLSAGSVSFNETRLNGLPPFARAKQGIGYVPQGREIFPLLTVKENLETGFAPLGRRDRNIPDDIFSLFPVLKSMLSRRGGDLSGGQQQQLAIGRAMVMRPKILVLDEATSHLDVAREHQVSEAIRALKVTRIIVAHRPETIASADRVIALANGKIVASGVAPALERAGGAEAIAPPGAAAS